MEEQFWLLVSRKLAGEATDEDSQALFRLLETEPRFKVLYEAISLYWSGYEEEETPKTSEVYEKIRQRMLAKKTSPKKSSRWLWASAGAAALLALSIGYGILFIDTPVFWRSLFWAEQYNAKGVKSKITLADGSTVWLNADSKIRFPRQFGKISREISLTGEAFFEVARDTSRPFVIQLHDGQIRVLGTSFNVKAFENEEATETSVVTGKVAFTPKKNNPFAPQPATVVLLPDFKVVYSGKTGTLLKKETNTATDKSWTENRLVFQSMRFEEVGRILERTYGKKVSFANDALKECKLTASFENNTLEEVMFLLAKTKNYQYQISAVGLLIAGEGCLPNE